MILVTGSSGKTGQAIIKALSKNKIKCRALIHKPAYEGLMLSAGADETIVGNFQNRNDLLKAMKGISSIYHICPNMHPQEFNIAKNVIKACVKNGCGRFVYHSVIHPQVRKMTHHWQKLRVEELLFESSLRYTILQPTAYMQNITGYWKQIITGKYVIPYPVETKISLIDLEDFAEVAVRVLTEPGHENAIYELVGTKHPISQTDIALALSKQLGYKVIAEAIPRGTWEENARTGGMSQYAIDTLLAMFDYYQNYGLYGNSNVLVSLLNRRPTDIFEFLARTIKTL